MRPAGTGSASDWRLREHDQPPPLPLSTALLAQYWLAYTPQTVGVQ